MPKLTLLFLALLALLASGCSLVEDQPTNPDKKRPLKVQHARGETRVPFLSDLPVTVDPAALETALALGVAPLGSTSWNKDGAQPAYLKRATADVENVGWAPKPRMPAIAALEPDVIIGNDLYQARLFGRFHNIAPTVYSGIPIKDWKGDVRFFGESLGRSDEGEALLIDWDRRAARVRKALGDDPPDEIVLPRDLRTYLDRSFVDSVLADVDVPAGAAVATGEGGGIIAARRVLDAVAAQAHARR